jgi:hypothetical protein
MLMTIVLWSHKPQDPEQARPAESIGAAKAAALQAQTPVRRSWQLAHQGIVQPCKSRSGIGWTL